VLQCVAVCGSVLQCVAVCCSVLQCVAVCCCVLRYCTKCRCGRGRCSVLQCVAVYCSVLQCVAVCCGVVQCAAAAGEGAVIKGVQWYRYVNPKSPISLFSKLKSSIFHVKQYYFPRQRSPPTMQVDVEIQMCVPQTAMIQRCEPEELF